MPAIATKNNLLVYHGSSNLRQRLVLSTLSGKSLKVSNIRSQNEDPGLREYEVNLIRLFDKITNGSVIELDQTGTSLFFQPGVLIGGNIEHECSLQRSIGYYLEPLLMLGFFCKNSLNAVLRGITAKTLDPSVDHIKAAAIPVMKRFIVDDEGLDIKVKKRGMAPLGGGEIVFKCPARKVLRPVQFSDPGMVKRVRGIAYALRVSPAMANRMVESAKGVLLKFLPDVYINTDQCRGAQSGKSPGFGINLVAETNKDVFYSADQMSNIVAEGQEPSVPEDLGVSVANSLLSEIYRGGCTDSTYQSLLVLFMALGQKDVSKSIIGPLSESTVAFLQHLKEFFGVTFKIEHVESSEDEGKGCSKVSLTCVGIGYTNLNKRTA